MEKIIGIKALHSLLQATIFVSTPSCSVNIQELADLKFF